MMKLVRDRMRTAGRRLTPNWRAGKDEPGWIVVVFEMLIARRTDEEEKK